MSLIAGTVSVDDSGNVTYSDNPSMSQAIFDALITSSATDSFTSVATTVDPKTGLTKIVTPTLDSNGVGVLSTKIVMPNSEGASPDVKKAQAKIANTLASALVPYLTVNTVVTTTIPVSAAGDGLQTSATAGNPTTRPAAPKTITGVIS